MTTARKGKSKLGIIVGMLGGLGISGTALAAVGVAAALFVLCHASGCSSLKDKERDLRERAREEISETTDELIERIIGEEPTPSNTEELPFKWSDVKWICGDGDPSAWDVTVKMLSPTLNDGDLVSWSYESPLTWPSSSAISVNPNACLAWVTMVDGKWYGAITEWLPHGQAWQSKKIFFSDRGSEDEHDYKFHDPLRTFEPEPKQVFYLFVCGLYWSGVRNVQERSNLVPVEFK